MRKETTAIKPGCQKIDSKVVTEIERNRSYIQVSNWKGIGLLKKHWTQEESKAMPSFALRKMMSNWEFYIEPQSLLEYESKIKIFFQTCKVSKSIYLLFSFPQEAITVSIHRSEFTKKARNPETRAPFQKQQHNLQDETRDQMKIPESLLQIY